MAFLGSCGGGSTLPAATSPQTSDDAGSTDPVADTLTPITFSAACQASGSGRDYQVGSGAGQLASLEQVPWESLSAGDTVRIFYRSTPYRGKMLLTAKGTAAAQVRVCGVKGPNGERPIIDGSDALTRAGLYYGNASAAPIQESRAVVMIKNTAEYTQYPAHIQIDGLVIRGAHPSYRFTDSKGASRQYSDFGACIWIDRGHNITLADNEITDCTNGIFSKSTDDGDFAVSRNLRIAGNYIHGNGLAGSDRLHNTYLQSTGVVYEFNRYGPQRSGAGGNAIKDRSVGTIVRFNRIEGGAHSVDLVEAEDFPQTATANPAYRTTFVYGNQIVKSGNTGSFIHYGGDHYGSSPGANWGEPFFRKGTLYFFHNTVYATGSGAVLFNLSTTEEKAEVWNNVFYFAPTVASPTMRQNTDIGANWTAGGIMNLGRNWINSNWSDSGGRGVPGQLNGSANMITGTAAPFDPSTMLPLAGSSILDAAQSPPAGAATFQLNYQVDQNYRPQPRSVSGSAPDLGAVER